MKPLITSYRRDYAELYAIELGVEHRDGYIFVSSPAQVMNFAPDQMLHVYTPRGYYASTRQVRELLDIIEAARNRNMDIKQVYQ